MNIGSFRGESNFEQLPFLSEAFSKAGQKLKGKLLAVRPVKTPAFKGLFVDVKVGATKYALGVRFDPSYDLDALATVCKSDDTDDWIGQTVIFVAQKGKKGNQLFANVVRPARKKKKAKR